jgi:curved DNA-binding protein CbpA
MSTGISVICEPEIEDLEGYFQELAAEYEVLSALLKKEGLDILPYLFCPESDLSDEEIASAGYSKEEIRALKVISQDDFHDADEVYDDIVQAADLVRMTRKPSSMISKNSRKLSRSRSRKRCRCNSFAARGPP